jgi:spermidine/putrescine transport system permease protein
LSEISERCHPNLAAEFSHSRDCGRDRGDVALPGSEVSHFSPADQEVSPPAKGKTGRTARWLLRSDGLRGYALMSPTLIILIIGVIVPFIILLTISFWTRDGVDFNTTPAMTNYSRAVNEPMFGLLLARTFWMSGMATVATILICYPMAYFVAFHVHQNKMLWLILITLPFWISYLLRVFAWKVILGYEGAINSTLMWARWIEAPLEFLLYSLT